LLVLSAHGQILTGVVSGTVGVQTVATPTDSPGTATYTTSQAVTLSDATGSAVICYTTDGNVPTATSAGTCDSVGNEATYSTAFTLTATHTVKAIGTKVGYVNSGTLSSTYTIQVAAPTDSPGQNTYTSAQTVTLSDATGGAVICYTTDGGTPTATTPGTCDSVGNEATYSTGFSTGPSTITVKAIGTKAGLTTSGLLTSVYTINISAPAFVSPAISQNTMTGASLIFPALTTSAGNTLWVVVGYAGPCNNISTGFTVTSTIGGTASGDTFNLTAAGWVTPTRPYSCVGAWVANHIHAGSANYVITATPSANAILGVALQFSGVSSLDQTCSGTKDSGSPAACSAAMTPSTTPQIVVGGMFDYYPGDTFAAASPFTLPSGATTTGSVGAISAIYYIANPVSGTYTPSFAVTGTSYDSITGATLK